MAKIAFDSGELIDGEINGWPASFIATNYGKVQGWGLHVAPYGKPNPIEDEEDIPSPEEIREICYKANDKAGDLRVATKGQISKIIEETGFIADPQ